MDKLTGIDIFVHAAKTGSFVGAAKQLGLTPSAVSKSVMRLESRLNVQLFKRTTRALHLTEEGQLLFDNASQAVAQLEQAQTLLLDADSEPQGTLRVSMPVVFGATHIAPLLAAFSHQYPAVVVETHSTDALSSLVDDGFDILIRTGELTDSNMIGRKLIDTQFMTCASPDYLEQFGQPHSPEDLVNFNCSRYQFPTTGRMFDWPFLVNGDIERIPVSGTQIFSNANAMITSALHGGGLVHLQDYMLQTHVDAGTLVPVLEDYACDGGPITAMYLRHTHLSPKIRCFVEFLIDNLSC